MKSGPEKQIKLKETEDRKRVVKELRQLAKDRLTSTPMGQTSGIA